MYSIAFILVIMPRSASFDLMRLSGTVQLVNIGICFSDCLAEHRLSSICNQNTCLVLVADVMTVLCAEPTWTFVIR